MSASPLVLLVEDDPHIRRFLRAVLKAQGVELFETETAAEALAQAAARNPSVVLLDLGLPDLDGIEVIRRLREWTHVPIIILSARGQEADKVAALDAGADDYLTKPFSLPELLARLRVALRHHARGQLPAPARELRVGRVHIDRERREVRVEGALVHLTPHEYDLAVVLFRDPGRVLTHRQLLEEVWGHAYVGRTHYLRVFMNQLRQKLEADPTRPQLLINEPGVGYRVRDPEAEG